MDVFCFIVLVLGVYGIKVAPRRQIWNKDGLEREASSSLRGLMSILIVLDHSALLTECGYSIIALKRIGPYVVALFYALSAYGLLSSYRNNDCSLKLFWKKRTHGTLLPYLLAYLMAVAVRLLLREQLTAKTILMSFINGKTLLLYSWFIETIMVFYLIFYFAARIAKRDLTFLIVLVFFVLFFYAFVMHMLGFSDYWFNAAWAFPLGLLWQLFYQRITAAFRKHPGWYLAISGSVALWLTTISEHFFWFSYLARLFSTLAVAVFVLLLLLKIKIVNPVLRFWGRISMEIYLLHGLLVLILTQFLSPSEQPYLFAGVLLIGTMLIAVLFSAGYKKLLTGLRIRR